MSFLNGMGLEVGVGLAIGMLAGASGTHGSARGRMTLLAGVIAFAIGFLLAGTANLSGWLGGLFCLGGAAVGCIVISDVVGGAGRREGGSSGALGFLVSVAALVVVGVTVLLKPFALLALAAVVWLGVSRHRRAKRKHAGLRVLR